MLIELFDRIESFFVRLQTHTEYPPSEQMTNVMGKVLAEVLSMLAIATKEMKQGRISGFFFFTVARLPLAQIRPETFLKKLGGSDDIGDALLRLDKLEQGELRTVTAQVLKVTNDLKDSAWLAACPSCNTIHTDPLLMETKVMVQQIVSGMSSRDCSYCHDLHRECLYKLTNDCRRAAPRGPPKMANPA